MDEALKAQMVAFAKRMLDAADQGASFAAEQTPLLVQEWLRWRATEAAVVAVFALVVLIALAAVLRKLATREMGQYCDDVDRWIPVGMCVIFVGFPAAIAFGVNLLTCLKVLIAPRVVVVEFIKGLL